MAVTVTQTSDSISRVEQIFIDEVTRSVIFDASTGIRQVAGTRDKFSMVELSTNTNILQAYATAPAETGDAAVSDVEFSIYLQSINLPVPYSLFANTKFKDAIDNIHSQGLPQEVQEAMVLNITKQARAEVESNIINGNDGATGSPTTTNDGWLKIINDKLTAATLGAQILSAATPTTVPANIQGILDDMVEVMPTALLADKEGVKFFMSPATKFAYLRSLETQNQAVLAQSADRFGGFQIVEMPNMNSRTILLGYAENLGIGTPSEVSQMISLDVIDQKENLKNQANIFGNFGWGAGAVTTDWVTFEDTTV